jgi:hypothetical protein
LSSHFSSLVDSRHPKRLNYSLHDTLLTGLAMFFFQPSSLLQFQTAMKQKRGRCNLETLFADCQLPSETQMRDLLDSFVTNLEVTKATVATVVGLGRSKWKIENEHFKVQKDHGDELEPNYGHGKKNLSMVYYLLNLLACLTPKLIERGDRQYQQDRELGESRRERWNVLRSLMKMILVPSWFKMRGMCLGEEAESG